MTNQATRKTTTKVGIGIALILLAILLLISLQYYAHTTTISTVDVIESTGVITNTQRETVDFANKLKPASVVLSGIVFAIGLIIVIRSRGSTA